MTNPYCTRQSPNKVHKYNEIEQIVISSIENQNMYRHAVYVYNIQRRRIEKEITWNRESVKNIVLSKGQKRLRYKAQAQLLQNELDIFKGVDLEDIEKCLRYQRANRGKSEFSMSVKLCDRKQQEIDTPAISHRKSSLYVANARNMNLTKQVNKLQRIINEDNTIIDGSNQRAKLLQDQLKNLQKMYDELKCEYSRMSKQCKEYKSKYDKNCSLEHQLNDVLQYLEKDKLPKKSYHKLMHSVLNKVRKSGHLTFDIGKYKIDAIVCSVFKEDNQENPTHDCLNQHTQNLNEFLKVKCRGNMNLQSVLIGHVINTRRWKQIALESLKVSQTLSVKESVQQFIHSNSSLRRFCKFNAK